MVQVLKRSLLFLVALFLLSIITHAQTAFNEGTSVLQLGIGGGRSSGYLNNAIYSSRFRTPVFVINYETAVGKKVGPGLLSVGVQGTFRNTSYRYTSTVFAATYRERSKWSDYGIAARVLYHLTDVDIDKLDIYGGVVGGPVFSRHTYFESYDGDPAYTKESRSFSINGWSAGFLAGARYYLSSSIGVYGELQYAWRLPYLSAGVAVKL